MICLFFIKSSNEQKILSINFINDKINKDYNDKKILYESIVSGAKKIFTCLTSFVLLPISLYFAYKNIKKEDRQILKKISSKDNLLIYGTTNKETNVIKFK